jgi:uncharacterized protein
MRFTPEERGNLNLVTSHAPECVRVGAATFDRPFLIAPNALERELGATTPAELGGEHVQRLLALQPQLVIIGAAGGYPQVPAAVRAALLSRGIGVELMELGAACRTYNLVVQEGRAALALLFPLPAAGGSPVGNKGT